MMNRTNRSIAALFILATLAVQPVATHAMAARISQFAQQSFNAAKQFASRNNLGGKAKSVGTWGPLGYAILDPFHGGSTLDRKTRNYEPDWDWIVPRTFVAGLFSPVALAASYFLAGGYKRDAFIRTFAVMHYGMNAIGSVDKIGQKAEEKVFLKHNPRTGRSTLWNKWHEVNEKIFG